MVNMERLPRNLLARALRITDLFASYLAWILHLTVWASSAFIRKTYTPPFSCRFDPVFLLFSFPKKIKTHTKKTFLSKTYINKNEQVHQKRLSFSTVIMLLVQSVWQLQLVLNKKRDGFGFFEQEREGTGLWNVVKLKRCLKWNYLRSVEACECESESESEIYLKWTLCHFETGCSHS